MFVYLAHPIDQATGDAPYSGADAIEDMLGDLGVSTYRPGRAFSLGQLEDTNTLSTVDKINTAALAVSNVLVAWLPPDVATLGVPAEIEQALRLNIPTLILTSASLMGRSVQLINWSSRGAEVVAWGPEQVKAWRTQPADLMELLTTRPQDNLMTPGMPNPCQPIGCDSGIHLPGCPFSFDDSAIDPFGLALPVKLTHPAAKEPSRAYPDDAGLDLSISKSVRLEPGDYALAPTGVSAAVPVGWWGMITGRSSTWARYRCDVRLAVIDAGYRGELMIGIENRGTSPRHFMEGTRLAQYVLIPSFPGVVQPVDELPEAHRGQNGYGSSGE